MIKLIIKGRVQGVFFRAFTRKIAQKLQITGTVKNSKEGHVEVYAAGSPSALKIFVDECHKGPLFAQVNDVVLTDISLALTFTDFNIIN